MEALAALGLAGNVVQFIHFASGLLSTGSEVYKSASGASEKTFELEKIYERFRELSSSLSNHDTTDGRGPSRGLFATARMPQYLSIHIDALKGLGKESKDLCDQILETLRKVKVQGGRWRRFRSFMAALEAAWDSQKIADLESRLERFQKMISFHFFPIFSEQQSTVLKIVATLKDESSILRVDQHSKLDAISKTLQDLTSKMNGISEQLSTNPSNPVRSTPAEAFSLKAWDAFQQSPSSALTLEQLDMLSTELSKLDLTEKEIAVVAREQVFLRSLHFPSRPVRHDNLPPAHEKTFQWMLDPPEVSEGEHDHQYPQWLKSGNGIFWVSGKPGSGKSTLMKFLADHETTKSLLEKWAGGVKLVIAAHYFWSAGTPMQKSYEGLFQTLIYDVLRVCPMLIPQVCPARWAETNPVRNDDPTQWTTSELLTTLKTLSSHLSLNIRYCFFIDGIDEFDGDHLKLCDILEGLSQSPNIKLCIASRPWNVFVDAFGNHLLQKIYMEDLTRDDIRRYTRSRLTEHKRWNLPLFRADDKQSIIDDISDKAQGVFLWVFLVTKSLRDGLTNGDSIHDLRKRLDSLPVDLERFFKHILEAVDPIYHEKTSAFLSIAVNARQPLHFLFYSMHECEHEDEDYAVKMPVSQLYQDQFNAMQDECRRRVNARCGGLLSIKVGHVEFLHRTVRDFLLTREMSSYISAKTRPGFSANISTLKASLAVLKCSPETISRISVAPGLLEEAMYYANEVLEDSEDVGFELLERLEHLYLPPEWGIPDLRFREALLRAGVEKYIERKLEETLEYFDNLSELPLDIVVKQPKWTARHVRTIRHLLEHGQNPNASKPQSFPQDTSWSSFIQRSCKNEHNDKFQIAIEMGLFSSFLDHGAQKSAAYRSFVHALFFYPLKTPTMCLEVLDQLIVSPKDGMRYGIMLTANSTDRMSYRILLKAIGTELQGLEDRSRSLQKLKFMATIVERVVRTGASLGFYMEYLVPDITRAFPGALGQRISELLMTKADGHEPGSRKRKANDDVAESETKRSGRDLPLNTIAGSTAEDAINLDDEDAVLLNTTAGSTPKNAINLDDKDAVGISVAEAAMALGDLLKRDAHSTPEDAINLEDADASAVAAVMPLGYLLKRDGHRRSTRW
ncbi:uncharacterized protein BDZ99DRAFT_240266 [Mytilinidion resinicola]|uniref:NACHT domain-containing protein n=1 Tax=Mytilinidion resinicola TaxID=574789 RepID=A0A6A6XXP0_9PEZI|nr:uncharacterized protein BDZ99DRAFT_240266 [Mytilinidion resinicola]KAF2801311.1 hypothetical protein BDZ99DRAFT_240266 [Mytilinidion resinicola]